MKQTVYLCVQIMPKQQRLWQVINLGKISTHTHTHTQAQPSKHSLRQAVTQNVTITTATRAQTVGEKKTAKDQSQR